MIFIAFQSARFYLIRVAAAPSIAYCHYSSELSPQQQEVSFPSSQVKFLYLQGCYGHLYPQEEWRFLAYLQHCPNLFDLYFRMLRYRCPAC